MSTRNKRRQQERAIVESTRQMIAAAILFSHQVAEQLKLGPSDAQFMTLLDAHGPMTPGQFAEMTGLRTGTVTGVILCVLVAAGVGGEIVRRRRKAERAAPRGD